MKAKVFLLFPLVLIFLVGSLDADEEPSRVNIGFGSMIGHTFGMEGLNSVNVGNLFFSCGNPGVGLGTAFITGEIEKDGEGVEARKWKEYCSRHFPYTHINADPDSWWPESADLFSVRLGISLFRPVWVKRGSSGVVVEGVEDSGKD